MTGRAARRRPANAWPSPRSSAEARSRGSANSRARRSRAAPSPRAASPVSDPARRAPPKPPQRSRPGACRWPGPYGEWQANAAPPPPRRTNRSSARPEPHPNRELREARGTRRSRARAPEPGRRAPSGLAERAPRRVTARTLGALACPSVTVGRGPCFVAPNAARVHSAGGRRGTSHEGPSAGPTSAPRPGAPSSVRDTRDSRLLRAGGARAEAPRTRAAARRARAAAARGRIRRHSCPARPSRGRRARIRGTASERPPPRSAARAPRHRAIATLCRRSSVWQSERPQSSGISS